LTLRRAPDLAEGTPELDDAQAAAVAHRGGVLRVLGAPGTGKTTLAVEAVVDRVRSDGLRPDQCLLLSPTRVAAAALRQRVTARLGGTSTEPLARTHQAFGFGILRQAAALRGDPTPRLLSGPEQDIILRELLSGHASGDGRAPDWPEHVVAALPTRGFRAELRDLLMRAVERGLDAGDLARLGREQERPEWVAAASVLAEYDEVTAFSRPGAYDPAWILGAAAELLEEDATALVRVRDALRLVVVDDAQELTSAASRLLQVVASPQIDLVLIGDPDVTVEGFRGADPRAFGQLAEAVGPAGGPTTISLGTSYRQPQVLREVAHRVTRRIGTVGGVAHREVATQPGGRCDVALVRAASQEAALIAAELRRAHLADGIPWEDMAVVVRGQGRTGALRRVLMASGVPVSVPATELPVRDEVAVRPLLALMEVALKVAWGDPDPLPAEVAVDALTSPVGGADSVSLRRLRRVLRREELEAGGGRTSDELLVSVVLDPDQLILGLAEAGPARRVARAVAAGVEAARTVTDESGVRRWAPGVTAETVLWAMWRATRLGEAWARTALDGGLSGARADRDLDAVVALFDAAARYVDRLPQMGPGGFLEHIRGQDVAGDTLVARAPSEHTDALVTAQGAAGREWRFVVVAGVQEGVWPDLRLRGSLLGSERLVDVLTGRGQSLRAAQAAVRYDETRAFLTAVSRARERLLVTAVRSEDEQPSVYLDLVDPLDDEADRDFAPVPRPATLPGVVAELRRELVSGTDEQREVAAAQLARLAAEEVRGADPAAWWALTDVSDDRPLRPDGAVVSVSPSRIEGFADCGLRWLLVTCGGDGPDQGAANIGTLIHDIAAELDDVDEPTLAAEVEARWSRLGLPDSWVSRKQKSEALEMVGRLARYYREARKEGWQRAGTELDLQVQLGRALLRGRVDRIETHPEHGVRVIDLKTGGRKPPADDLPRHPQLGAYQVAIEHGAFEEAGDVSAGAALLQIGKASLKNTTLQEQDPLARDDDPAWAEELVLETAEGMAAPTVLATIGDGCTRCPVRTSCPLQPEGRAI
jgi:superfamily I DNA/RNA helicase/RecB family exonuclease